MQFRTLALATTSLVALGLTAQANAATEMMGDLTLGYAYNWEEYDFGSEGSFHSDYPSVLGGGRVNLPYSDTLNIQLDVVGRTSVDALNYFDGKAIQAGHFGLGGHINYRDDQGLLGVFAATGRVNEAYFDLASEVFLAGFEGQYYCGPWTFRGQIAYMDSGEAYLLTNTGLIRTGANYYLGNDIKFTADIAYMDGEFGVTELDAEQWAWSAAAHYWFGKSIPVSGFVEYRGRQAEVHDGADDYQFDHHSVNLGLTFHFGGKGFEDADKNGASTDLPDLEWYRTIGD
jgi:hypothetical protein